MKAVHDKNTIKYHQDAIWTYYQNNRAEDFEGARPRMAYILKAIEGKLRHLEPLMLNIGAGNGDFERMAASKGWKIYSIDPDEETVDRLKSSGIKAVQGRIEKMVFEDGRFDFVVASEVLEHLSVEQFKEGFAEVNRVLKPGGWFIGTVPYKENLRSNIVYCPNCKDEFHRWGHMRSFDLTLMRNDLGAMFGNVLVKKTAFVSLRGHGIWGLIKGGMRIAMAKMGEEIACPSIFFMARKKIIA